MWPEISHDRRFVVVSIVEGTENRNRLWVYPVLDEPGPSRLGEPFKLVDTPVAEFGFVRVVGGRLCCAPISRAAGAAGRAATCDVRTRPAWPSSSRSSPRAEDR